MRPTSTTRTAALLLCATLPTLHSCDSKHAGHDNETAVVIPNLVEAVRRAGQRNGQFSESESQHHLAAIMNGFARDLKENYGEAALTDNATFNQINFIPIAAAALTHGMILSYSSSFVEDKQTGDNRYRIDLSLLKIGSEISPPPDFPLAVGPTVPNAGQSTFSAPVLNMFYALKTPGANTPVSTVVLFEGKQRILLDLEAIKKNDRAAKIDSK